MDVTQLRVGNFIDNNVECLQIKKDDLFFLLHADNEHYANPVTLTGTWLIEFGFNFGDYEGHYRSGNGDVDLMWNSAIGFRLSVEGQYGWNEIKYVHQLQNLFYCLTGEELVIKSND